MAPKETSLWSRDNLSFLSQPIAKLRLTYYQYTVTLPIYGLHPIEKCILNVLVAFSILVSLRIVFYLLCIALRLVGIF